MGTDLKDIHLLTSQFVITMSGLLSFLNLCVGELLRSDFFVWVLDLGLGFKVLGFGFKVISSRLLKLFLRTSIPFKESSSHYESMVHVTQAIIKNLKLLECIYAAFPVLSGC